MNTLRVASVELGVAVFTLLLSMNALAATLARQCGAVGIVTYDPPPYFFPTVAVDAAPEAVTNAIESAGFVDAAVKEVIGGSAVEYTAFKEWARSVKVPIGGDGGGAVATQAGEAAVVANTNAAAAYLLGAERLFENAPKVEFGEVSVADDEGGGALGITRPTMTVMVTVKDGDEAVKCAAEKVKGMFEATSDLGDWNGAAKMLPSVTVEDSEGATMRFKVTPGDGTAMRAFLRIRK